MTIELLLSKEKILEKVFPGSYKGYDPVAVDSFLDKIIEDYSLISKSVILSKEEYDKMNASLNKYKQEKMSLEIELGKCKNRLDNIKQGDAVNSDNIDLIKRINVLEKYIFSLGVDPHTIK